MCGPQNYMKDVLKEDYHEPMTETEVKELFKKLVIFYLFLYLKFTFFEFKNLSKKFKG